VAANVLAREFGADEPNQRWVGDKTELTTRSGRLFLAAPLDLHSRLVVGWATSAVSERRFTSGDGSRGVASVCRGRRSGA
jgi:transposase InsO family protein